MMSEIPEIDSCCEKEIYAFFGLAAYCSQVIEHSALNLAIVLKLPDVSEVDQVFFDELYESLSKKTFGQLLKKAKGLIDLSEEDRIFLDEALELRNILMHRYFREHAETVLSQSGRHSIKQELQLIISKFKRADTLLATIYEPLWEQYGVTAEFIENELREMQARAEYRDENA